MTTERDPSGPAPAVPATSGDDGARAAQGASTLAEVLSEAEDQGHTGEFQPVAADGAPQLRCPHCDTGFPPEEAGRIWVARLEGASDPDDMLSVSALRCPRCDATGVLIAPYGPAAGELEAGVLPRLPAPTSPDLTPHR